MLYFMYNLNTPKYLKYLSGRKVLLYVKHSEWCFNNSVQSMLLSQLSNEEKAHARKGQAKMQRKHYFRYYYYLYISDPMVLVLYVVILHYSTMGWEVFTSQKRKIWGSVHGGSLSFKRCTQRAAFFCYSVVSYVIFGQQDYKRSWKFRFEELLSTGMNWCMHTHAYTHCI